MSTDNNSLENKATDEILAESNARTNLLSTDLESILKNIQIGGRNYLLDSRYDKLTLFKGHGGGTRTLVEDEHFGTVVEYSRPNGGGEFQSLHTYNNKGVSDQNIVYFVIAKDMTGGGAFCYGGWNQSYAYLNQESKKVDKGNGWYMYWTTFKSGATLGTTFGLNTVKGTWRFYAAGILQGNIPTDWSPAPEDVENKIALEINKIQIGGRNYLLDSKLITVNASSSVWTQRKITVDMVQGASYTLSYESTDIVVNSNNYPAFWIWKHGIWTPRLDLGNIAQKERTFIFNLATGQYSLMVFQNVNPQSGIINKLQLEKGNKATDWTPAPEDSTYEEGTWTPIVEGSSTQGVAQYTVNNARYVRTGNMITTLIHPVSLQQHQQARVL